MARDADRFLGDPGLRATLYHNADGLCQKCGNPLPDSWHADHVIPWSLTQRTNVLEMQALCRNPEAGRTIWITSNSYVPTAIGSRGTGSSPTLWPACRKHIEAEIAGPGVSDDDERLTL